MDEALDRLFSAWDRDDSPGCTVALARGGELLLARGYGLADLDHGVPNGPEILYPIGSMSKQFTAFAVALLADEGQVSLDDDVRRFLPELWEPPRPIRLRHLIHNQSGLRDYNVLRFVAGAAPSRASVAESLELVARQRGLNFLPGDEYQYSNTNFVLLRIVVERVTGQRFDEWSRQRIFKPLGMDRTVWSEDYSRPLASRAGLYTGDDDGGYRQRLPTTVAGSGGVWTTVADFARWQHHFAEPRLGSGRPLVERVLKPSEPGGYAFGLFHGEHEGRPIVWHAGSGAGYSADALRFPGDELSVLCFCNGMIDSRRLSRQVASVALGTLPLSALPSPSPPPREPPPPEPEVALSTTGREAWLGTYRIRGLERWIRLTGENGRLAAHWSGETHPLRAISADALRPDDPRWDWRLRRSPAEPGVVDSFESGKLSLRLERLADPLPEDLRAFAGIYDCHEIGNPWHVRERGGALWLANRVEPRGFLVPDGEDRFLFPTPWWTFALQFERDAGGAVTSFVLDADPVRGLRFDRR